jgi:hypothetical protein
MEALQLVGELLHHKVLLAVKEIEQGKSHERRRFAVVVAVAHLVLARFGLIGVVSDRLSFLNLELVKLFGEEVGTVENLRQGG